jgi:hypothetical protein
MASCVNGFRAHTSNTGHEGFENSPAAPQEHVKLTKKGGISVKKFIYNIIGLLALLSISVMPAYAAGMGGSRGSGGGQGSMGYRGSGGSQGSGGYHGSGGYRGSGGYHGYSGYRGYGGYHGSGHYYGHGGYNGHGNSYSARIFIGPGWWGPGYWGPPAYPYYPYYSYYPAPPVVVEQQPQAYVQQNQQESDYWYYCQNPEGYYPYVKSCPGGWMKVVPDAAPPGR